jgi:hypothetical protein
MNKTSIAASALLLALTTTAAHADGDTWKYTFTPYVWVPGIDASAKIPPAAQLPNGPVFPVTKSNVLGALNMAFMGSFEARKGDWSVYADVNYADMSFKKQAPTALVIKGKVDFDETLVELAVARTLWSDSSGTHIDALFGGRYIDVNSDLTLTLANRQFKFSADRNDADVIVGLKGDVRLGDGGAWFIPYYGDIGGGSSNHSWLASVGLGRTFGWGDLSLSYRYFEFDPGSSSPIEDVRLYGPNLALAFHF